MYSALGLPLFVWFMILRWLFLPLIVVPYHSLLVRLRANYTPRRHTPQIESGVRQSSVSNVTSFLDIVKRVKRIEGWTGFYKGAIASFLADLAASSFIALVITFSQNLGHTYGQTMFALDLQLLKMFTDIPGKVIIYRCMTTPQMLSMFRPLEALRTLFTPAERRRPWLLYKTPGLIAVGSLRVLLNVLGSYDTPSFLVDYVNLRTGHHRAANYGLMLGRDILALAIWCPLEVTETRLAIQRNKTSQGHSSEVSGASHEKKAVIRLRDEAPYAGLVDCTRRIVVEEGWGTLYRTWPMMIFNALGLFIFRKLVEALIFQAASQTKPLQHGSNS